MKLFFKPMKTSFVVPLIASVGLHVIVLFAFNNKEAAPVTRLPEPEGDVIRVSMRPPDPDVVEESSGGGSPGPALPSTPDLPAAPIATAFQVPIERNHISVTDLKIDRISVTPPGDGISFGDANGPGTGRIPDVLSANLLDQPPRARSQPPPVYPFEQKRTGQGGEVVVSFRVDETGRVYTSQVVKSTAREFEEAALRAVDRWVFQPGMKDGKKVRFGMVVPIVFSITTP